MEVGARSNVPAATKSMIEEDAVPISNDILNRRATRFVLWSPRMQVVPEDASLDSPYRTATATNRRLVTASTPAHNQSEPGD